MATKKQKAKNKAAPALSAVIGTVFNMATTAAAFGSVLLCLVIAKRLA